MKTSTSLDLKSFCVGFVIGNNGSVKASALFIAWKQVSSDQHSTTWLSQAVSEALKPFGILKFVRPDGIYYEKSG